MKSSFYILFFKVLAYVINCQASLVIETVKNLPAMQETQVQILSQADPLEKGIATYSSILAWREEPGGLQNMGS